MGFLTRARRHERTPMRRGSWHHVFLALTLAASACGPASDAPLPSTASGAWLEFDGSWNAAGTRRIIPLGAERTGSVVHLRGTMLLSGPGRPGTGFHKEWMMPSDS